MVGLPLLVFSRMRTIPLVAGGADDGAVILLLLAYGLLTGPAEGVLVRDESGVFAVAFLVGNVPTELLVGDTSKDPTKETSPSNRFIDGWNFRGSATRVAAEQEATVVVLALSSSSLRESTLSFDGLLDDAADALPSSPNAVS